MNQNIVEFILSLKDQWSSPLAKVTKSTVGAGYTVDQLTEANKKLQLSAGKSAGSLSDLKTKINSLRQTKELIPVSATKQMRELNKEINKLQAAVDKADGIPPSGGFSKMFSGIPKAIPFALIAAGVTKAIGGALGDGKIKQQFKNEFGDKAGSGLYESLKKMKSILGDEVMDMGKQLAGAGVPIGLIEDKIKRLGDVANGDQGKMQSLIGAFSELRKDGKLTEGVMSQLEAGGFKPLVLMSQQTGVSLSRLRERFAAGKISAKQIEDALAKATDAGGQFAGNMDRLNSTDQAGWDKMISNIGELSDKFANLLLPVFRPIIKGVSDLADWTSILIERSRPLLQWMKDNKDMLMTFGGAILTTITVIKAISTAKTLWGLVTEKLIPKIFAMNAALLANPIGLVIALVAGLVVGIAIAWNKFEGFRKAIYGVWETVKEVFTSIGQLFKQIFGPIGEAITAIKEGRWMDASKAAGKLLFNLSPVGIVKNVVEFSKGGGFDNVMGAYQKGAIKGAESWAKSQADKLKDPNSASLDAVGVSDEDKEKYNAANDKNNASAGINAIAGGGTKNITISIGKMMDNTVFHIQNGNKQMAQEIEKMMTEAMIRVLASADTK